LDAGELDCRDQRCVELLASEIRHYLSWDSI
jgi:hypothetical protein